MYTAQIVHDRNQIADFAHKEHKYSRRAAHAGAVEIIRRAGPGNLINWRRTCIHNLSPGKVYALQRARTPEKPFHPGVACVVYFHKSDRRCVIPSLRLGLVKIMHIRGGCQI